MEKTAQAIQGALGTWADINRFNTQSRQQQEQFDQQMWQQRQQASEDKRQFNLEHKRLKDVQAFEQQKEYNAHLNTAMDDRARQIMQYADAEGIDVNDPAGLAKLYQSNAQVRAAFDELYSVQLGSDEVAEAFYNRNLKPEGFIFDPEGGGYVTTGLRKSDQKPGVATQGQTDSPDDPVEIQTLSDVLAAGYRGLNFGLIAKTNVDAIYSNAQPAINAANQQLGAANDASAQVKQIIDNPVSAPEAMNQLGFNFNTTQNTNTTPPTETKPTDEKSSSLVDENREVKKPDAAKLTEDDIAKPVHTQLGDAAKAHAAIPEAISYGLTRAGQAAADTLGGYQEKSNAALRKVINDEDLNEDDILAIRVEVMQRPELKAKLPEWVQNEVDRANAVLGHSMRDTGRYKMGPQLTSETQARIDAGELKALGSDVAQTQTPADNAAIQAITQATAPTLGSDVERQQVTQDRINKTTLAAKLNAQPEVTRPVQPPVEPVIKEAADTIFADTGARTPEQLRKATSAITQILLADPDKVSEIAALTGERLWGASGTPGEVLSGLQTVTANLLNSAATATATNNTAVYNAINKMHETEASVRKVALEQQGKKLPDFSLTEFAGNYVKVMQKNNPNLSANAITAIAKSIKMAIPEASVLFPGLRLNENGMPATEDDALLVMTMLEGAMPIYERLAGRVIEGGILDPTVYLSDPVMLPTLGILTNPSLLQHLPLEEQIRMLETSLNAGLELQKNLAEGADIRDEGVDGGIQAARNKLEILHSELEKKNKESR